MKKIVGSEDYSLTGLYEAIEKCQDGSKKKVYIIAGDYHKADSLRCNWMRRDGKVRKDLGMDLKLIKTLHIPNEKRSKVPFIIIGSSLELISS